MTTQKLGGAEMLRAFARLALIAATLAAAACKTFIDLEVDPAYEKLSPPYVVTFVNETGAPFEVLPSEYGKASHGNARVQPGETFQATLQLRRVRVGTGSSVKGLQVTDSPYFEHSPPNRAEIRFHQRDTHAILISLEHASWVEPYGRASGPSLELRVPVRVFSAAPLFPRGPPGGP